MAKNDRHRVESSGSEFDDAFASRRSFSAPIVYDHGNGSSSTGLFRKLESISDSAHGLVRALSRGFSTGLGDERESSQDNSTNNLPHNVNDAQGNESVLDYVPIHKSMLNRVGSDGKLSIGEVSIDNSIAQSEKYKKKQKERTHRNAVITTSFVTSFTLFALLGAIAFAPIPTHREQCYGCCSDIEPCEVFQAPESMRHLARDEIAAIVSESSGYSSFTGEIKHTCYCSTARQSDTTDEAINEFFFQRETDKHYKDLSRVDNLLDGSRTTFWCSIPTGLDQFFDAGSKAADLLSQVIFPMYATFSVRVGGDVVTDQQQGRELSTAKSSAATSALLGMRIRLSKSNECAARVVQVQCASSPDTFFNLITTQAWLNVTERITLCCSDDWQFIPFNSTDIITGNSGDNAIVRLVVLSSFGNENRVTINEVQIMTNATAPPSMVPTASVVPSSLPSTLAPTALPSTSSPSSAPTHP